MSFFSINDNMFIFRHKPCKQMFLHGKGYPELFCYNVELFCYNWAQTDS